jgi:hypothetical protein
MTILTPGYKYIAANFENPQNGQTIQFIEKESSGPNGEVKTVNDGTTNEALIEILVDRLNVMNAKFPCRETSIAVTHLETALLWLKERTAKRVKRGVEGKHLA